MAKSRRGFLKDDNPTRYGVLTTNTTGPNMLARYNSRMVIENLKTTPLNQWHHDAKARMAEFAGYEMPIQYGSIVGEHEATRNRATLFDISHMGRFRFDGARAELLLGHMLTRGISDMQTGEIRYSLMCNESGGILDDVLVYCLEAVDGGTYFLLVVNAGNRAKILAWLKPHLADFPDVKFRDVSDATAMIAVQGPQAVAITQRLFKTQIDQLKYYRGRVCDQMGKPTIVSRTGYTGEDGFELIVRAEDAVRVWENLLLAGRDAGIMAAGLGARDTLRLEAGMPLYGHELSESINPFAAGLGRSVTLADRIFIGSDELNIISQQPVSMQRVGVRLEGRRAARQGAMILDYDKRPIGSITSGSFSPTLGYPIAMAFIEPAVARIGASIDVDIRGSKVAATIVPLPFYKRTKVKTS